MAAPQPLPGLRDFAPYVGGESAITGFDQVIKLASNEGAFGPSPKTQAAVRAHAAGYHRYPDGAFTELRELLGAHHGLAANRLVIGAGSDELISLLCRCYATQGDEILLSEHGFSMYPIYGRAVGATIVNAPEDGISVDVDAMLAAVTGRTKLVFLANPNNPTGTYLSAGEMTRLHQGLAENVLLVIDSAYAEYVDAADYASGAELVHDHANVVMLRTFSKIYGLGGLRLGWGYFPGPVADILNRMRSPFNVSSAAVVAGIAALQDTDFIAMSQRHNAQWREWTAAQLRDLGLTVPDSAGNFLVVRFSRLAGRNLTPEAADEFLKSRGIIVRGLAGYGLPDALRITIGQEDEMRAVVDALREFMS